MKEDTILKVLPWDVRSIIQKEKLEFEYLQEIRLRGIWNEQTISGD